MFPNRLKLGQKKKEPSGLRPTKLTLAFHERNDFDNQENQSEREPVETTQLIKSTPSIQICSSKLFPPQNNPITPFNQTHTRPLTHREGTKHQVKISDDRQTASQVITEYRAKLQQTNMKMDEYKTAITTLTLQNETLKKQQQTLENNQTNCMKDYYQQQIARLKGESQRHRNQNMANIQKLQQFYHERSQMQESKKKMVDQNKTQIKQLERQKLMSVELKNQQSQKEKLLNYALQQSQKANQMLNINNIALSERNAVLQNEITQRKMGIQSLNKQNQILTARFQQCQNVNIAVRKRYEEILTEKEVSAIKSINEHKAKISTLEDNVCKLTIQLKNLKNEQQERTTQMTKLNMNIKNQQQNIDKSLKIKNLEQQNKDLKFIISGQDKTIQTIEMTLKQYFSPQQYANLEKKIKQVEDKRLTSAKYYEEKLYNLQKENERLKIEMISTQNTPTFSNEGGVNFNQILKKNLEELSSIKQQLKAKIDQNQELMRQMIDIKLKEKTYTNEIQILSKKLESKQKNIKIQLEVERQKSTNETDSLRRKMQTLETRLEYKISENKQKDDFIKNTIIGRTKASDVPFIVSELERIFLGRDQIEAS